MGLARLPDRAFLIDELEKGWLRVDRHGRMKRLPRPARLPSGHVGGLATTADGTVLVAAGGVVWQLRPGRAVSRLAGTGGHGPISIEDGPALAATIGTAGIAVRQDGSALVADPTGNRVRVVRDGMIRTIAGNGRDDRSSGDGGPATSATVPEPVSVSAFADGSFLIASEGTRVVRRVDARGRISTVAGGGQRGSEGTCVRDGTPARTMRLYRPSVLALGDRSFLLVVSNAIYRVDRHERARRILALTSPVATRTRTSTVGRLRALPCVSRQAPARLRRRSPTTAACSSPPQATWVWFPPAVPASGSRPRYPPRTSSPSPAGGSSSGSRDRPA